MFRMSLIVLLITCNLLSLKHCLAIDRLSTLVRKQLQTRIETVGIPQEFVCRGELICGSLVIPSFYEHRGFSPAWSDDNGPLPRVQHLLQTIREAHLEGLRASDYHLSRIECLLAELRKNMVEKNMFSPERLADLDLLLTDSFLVYASHLSAGRVNPETVHTEWIVDSRTVDLPSILQRALDSDQITKVLKGLLPPHPGYNKLRQTLINYRDIATKGGWPSVRPGKKIKVGDQDGSIVLLRRRLIISGDLQPSNDSESDLFDHALDVAVQRFQRRHGLAVDGIVGTRTQAALNLSVEERLRQIELNMERWRWLHHDLGNRYVVVNAANFQLEVVENNQTVMPMRAVVGRFYRRTPVFSSKMTCLVLNPYWRIPPNIARRDILPRIRRDPDYLIRQKIRIFQGWDPKAPEIEPENIDWRHVEARGFTYKFRQDPGPFNPLGRVKFMFPNKFNVYIHDTPARELFQRSKRDFSSGCIRIERPIDLAVYLLGDNPRWTRQRIQDEIDSGINQVVLLPRPIMVHLLYWTAWVDADGTIEFREDIYGRDRLLDQALKEKPPIH
jgi:murein L,D-transpeptidase YcbB/YkuD